MSGHTRHFDIALKQWQWNIMIIGTSHSLCPIKHYPFIHLGIEEKLSSMYNIMLFSFTLLVGAQIQLIPQWKPASYGKHQSLSTMILNNVINKYIDRYINDKEISLHNLRYVVVLHYSSIAMKQFFIFCCSSFNYPLPAKNATSDLNASNLSQVIWKVEHWTVLKVIKIG